MMDGKWGHKKGVTLLLVGALIFTGCSKVKTIDVPTAQPTSANVPIHELPSVVIPTSPGAPASLGPVPVGQSPGNSGNGDPKPIRRANPNSSFTGQADTSIEGAGASRSMDFNVVVGYPYYLGPGKEVSITWLDPQGDSLTLGGTVKLGTTPTGGNGPILDFSLTNGTAEPTPVLSSNGTCDVTFTVATNRHLRGTFDCPSISMPAGLVHMAGSLDAKMVA